MHRIQYQLLDKYRDEKINSDPTLFVNRVANMAL